MKLGFTLDPDILTDDDLVSRRHADRRGLTSGRTRVHVTSSRLASGAGEVGRVLVHVGVKAKDSAKTGLFQGRSSVATGVGLDEQLSGEHVSFRRGRQNQITTRGIRLVVVHLFARGEDEVLGVSARHLSKTTNLVDHECRGLANQDAIDCAGNLHRGRGHVHIDQVLEGLGTLAVLDRERNVDVLIQGNLHVRGRRILINNVVAVRFPLCDELSGTAGIDNVTEVGDFHREITVDHHFCYSVTESPVRSFLSHSTCLHVGRTLS